MANDSAVAVGAALTTRVLLLETDLDHDLSSERSQIPFLREFMRHSPDVELIAKEVHTCDALEKFLDVARTDPEDQDALHGTACDGATSLVLTGHEEIDLRARENQFDAEPVARLHRDEVAMLNQALRFALGMRS